MKKLLLLAAAMGALVAPLLITQWASLYQYGELRSWMAGGAPQEILVGAAWPFAQNQDGMAEGLLLAQEELNAGGVRGRRFRLVLRDDDLDRETSRNISIDFARNPRMTAAVLAAALLVAAVVVERRRLARLQACSRSVHAPRSRNRGRARTRCPPRPVPSKGTPRVRP